MQHVSSSSSSGISQHWSKQAPDTAPDDMARRAMPGSSTASAAHLVAGCGGWRALGSPSIVGRKGALRGSSGIVRPPALLQLIQHASRQPAHGLDVSRQRCHRYAGQHARQPAHGPDVSRQRRHRCAGQHARQPAHGLDVSRQRRHRCAGQHARQPAHGLDVSRQRRHRCAGQHAQGLRCVVPCGMGVRQGALWLAAVCQRTDRLRQSPPSSKTYNSHALGLTRGAGPVLHTCPTAALPPGPPSCCPQMRAVDPTFKKNPYPSRMEKSSQGSVPTGRSGTTTGRTFSAANLSPRALTSACARDAHPATVASLRSTAVTCARPSWSASVSTARGAGVQPVDRLPFRCAGARHIPSRELSAMQLRFPCKTTCRAWCFSSLSDCLLSVGSCQQAVRLLRQRAGMVVSHARMQQACHQPGAAVVPSHLHR